MAERLEIVDALESLAVHCRAPIMDVDSKSRWMQTWCEDLMEYPIETIRAACRAWRQSDNTKFPTPGQLLPMVRAGLIKPVSEAANNRSWSWPSDGDLAAMTLREQRRQYLIMAHQCRGKAGPMGDDGQHPRPEWIGKAKAYDEEAKRVASLISRGAQADLNRSGTA